MPTKRHEEERERESACAWERERDLTLWLFFLYVFSSPLGLPYINWASQECCLFHLRSSLRSSDLPCLLATAILDSSFLF